MTPDTAVYMIAGFTVILAGILIYTLTLLFRIRAVRTQTKKMDELLEDLSDHLEK